MQKGQKGSERDRKGQTGSERVPMKQSFLCARIQLRVILFGRGLALNSMAECLPDLAMGPMSMLKLQGFRTVLTLIAHQH